MRRRMRPHGPPLQRAYRETYFVNLRMRQRIADDRAAGKRIRVYSQKPRAERWKTVRQTGQICFSADCKKNMPAARRRNVNAVVRG